jgi:hypothetical protein
MSQQYHVLSWNQKRLSVRESLVFKGKVLAIISGVFLKWVSVLSSMPEITSQISLNVEVVCVVCQPFCDFHPVGHDGEGGGIQIIDHLVQGLDRCVSSFDAGRTKYIESRKTEETISGTEVKAKCPAVLPNVTSCILGRIAQSV